MRAVRYFTLALLAILVLLGALVAWAVTTESGTRVLLSRVVLPLAGAEASRVQGRLSGPITLHDVRLELGQGRAGIERFHLDWQPLRLLAGELDVELMQIEGASIALETVDRPEDESLALELPIGLDVRRLEIRDAEVRRNGEPLVAGLSATLSVRATGRDLEIGLQEARADQGSVDGRASLSFAPDREWDVDLRWRLDNLGDGQSQGQVRAQGVMSDLALEASFDLPKVLPGNVVLIGRAGWIDGAIEIERLLADLEHGGRVAMAGRVRPDEELQLDLSVTAEAMRWPMDTDSPQLRVPAIALELRGVGDRYRVGAEGTLRVGDLPETELALQVEWLSPTLTVEQLRFETEALGLRAGGTATARMVEEHIEYAFELDGSLDLPEYPQLEFNAQGQGTPDHLELHTLRAAGWDGEVAGRGMFDWGDAPEINLSLTARDINPEVKWPTWPGRLGARITLQGTVSNGRDLTVAMSALQGSLRDREIQGALRARLREEAILLEHADIELGETNIAASGRFSDNLGFMLRVDSGNLGDLHPQARGTLLAAVEVDGPPAGPRVLLEASGRELGWAGYSLSELKASAEVDLDEASAATSRVEVEMGVLQAAGPLFQRASVRAAGMRDDHRLELAAEREEAHLTVSLHGAVTDSLHWSGRLEDLAMTFAGETLWRLREPTPVLVAADRAGLETACVDGGLVGRTCVEATWRAGEGWRGALSLDRLDLRPLSEWLGGPLVATGSLGGRVELDGGGAGFEHLSGQVEASAGTLSWAEHPDEPLLGWMSGRLSLAGDAAAARSELSVDLGAQGGVQGRLEVAWNEDDPALDGRLAAELAQTSLVSVFIPNLAEVEGRVGAALNLQGSVADPSLNGELSWEDGAARVPMLGLDPHHVQLHATLDSDEGLRFSGSARLGEGVLSTEGRFTLPPESLAGEARITGRDVLVADLPDVQLNASPELVMRFAENRILIEGDVRIPYGRITGAPNEDAPETVVQVSTDEIMLGGNEDSGGANDEGLELLYDIRMLIGPDVHLEVAGLAGELEGDVRVHQGEDGLAHGRGEVRFIDGTFRLFEQELIVTEGRFSFSDTPLVNPALDIRAALTTENLEVGVLIRGSRVEPQVTLFSDPPMPHGEALSYMITGKGLHDLRTDEAGLVQSASNSLMLVGDDLLALQVGTRLGFDEMGATGGAQPGSADLIVGRHLGSRLFVSYGVGLYQAISALRVQYRLGPRWAIEVISGEVSSADLISTMQR